MIVSFRFVTAKPYPQRTWVLALCNMGGGFIRTIEHTIAQVAAPSTADTGKCWGYIQVQYVLC